MYRWQGKVFFCQDYFPTRKKRKKFGERKLVMHFFYFIFRESAFCDVRSHAHNGGISFLMLAVRSIDRDSPNSGQKSDGSFQHFQPQE